MGTGNAEYLMAPPIFCGSTTVDFSSAHSRSPSESMRHQAENNGKCKTRFVSSFVA